jgi:hypothetical protein
MRLGAGARFVGMLLGAQLCLAGDCVDGVTPDCSDPAVRCGPSLDGSAFDAPAETSIDSSSPADASPADASPADADAGDQ